MWRKFLPSAQVFLFGGAVFLSAAVVGGLVLLRDKPWQHDAKGSMLAASTPEALTQKIAQKDSDGDNLPDWEEQLRGSDMHNPDSDGDGTPDGAEVQGGRDPLVAGPDDVLSFDPQAQADIPNLSQATSTNFTGAITRDVFGVYLALKQNNQLTEENVDALFSQAATVIEPALAPEAFALADIKTTPDSSAARAQAYRDELQAAFAATTGMENPLITFGRLIDNEPGAKDALAAQLALLSSLIETLGTLTVPENARELHLALLNGTVAYRSAALQLSLVQEDPLRAMVGVNQFSTAMADMVRAQQNLGVYFREKGVVGG